VKIRNWKYQCFKPYQLVVVSLLVLAIGMTACNKEEQTLILNESFLEVADLLQYCQGTCNEILDWEDEDAWVKGYILNFSNDSTRNEYYNSSSFLLHDIRNGMSIEVRVEGDKDPVFDKIWPADHKNQFFIKGIAKAVIAYNDEECTKGVVLSLTNPEDINFE